MTVGAVILAAGAATRMGRIKQLLPYQGKTLVEHAISQAAGAGFVPLVVVLGAEAAAVGQAVSRTDAASVVNEEWALGMGGSISCGVAKLLGLASGISAVAILLADQPHVLAPHLLSMKQVFEGGSTPIVAAQYSGTLGVPAFFGQSVFAKLKALPAEAGARLLLRGGSADVAAFALPEAAIDIDTPDDFLALGK